MVISTTLEDAVLRLTNFDLDEADLKKILNERYGAKAEPMLCSRSTETATRASRRSSSRRTSSPMKDGAAAPSLRFPDVAAAVVNGLDRIGASDSETGASDGEAEEDEEKRPLDPQFLENLLRALQHFNGGVLCSAAAEGIVSRPEIFNPVTLVVPAVEGICAGRRQKSILLEDAIRHLWTSAAEVLLRRSETPPEPPSDWRLDVEIKCRCADCLSLKAFARDAAALVYRFRVNKQRRSHLHGIID